MATYPVKSKKRALRKSLKNEVVDVQPASTAFFSFRYSSTEVSVTSGKTRIKARSTRFENGTLASEAFEGELDRDAYDRMVSHARQAFIRALTLLLPFRD